MGKSKHDKKNIPLVVRPCKEDSGRRKAQDGGPV